MKYKQCVLEDDKTCVDCGNCDFCDLNPQKLCDNCECCIDTADDYNVLKIDEIEINNNL